MLIPRNCSYKNSNHVQEEKRELERNKMELTYLCGMLYIMCTRQISNVFKMEISKILRPQDTFLEHFVESSNTYIRNSLCCYFRLAGVYFSTFPTCSQRKITQASECNSMAWSKRQGGLSACTVFTRLCAQLVRGCVPWEGRETNQERCHVAGGTRQVMVLWSSGTILPHRVLITRVQKAAQKCILFQFHLLKGSRK